MIITDVLKDLNNYTNTDPAYRSNLSIYYDNAGNSSYQSEYPFQMTKSKNSILSSLFVLINGDATNYICIRNIFHEPIIQNLPALLCRYR